MASSTIRPIVAIAGGTGSLGSHITTALLSPQFRSSFKEVRLLTQNTASEKAQSFAAKGAKTFGVNYTDEQTVLSAIHGADVLINALGGSVAGFPAKNALLAAALKDGGIKVYIPSEFGIDHRSNDFEHLEWSKKKDHAAKARQSNMKVCQVYCGLFMEHSFGPWFGYNTKKGVYESIGSSTTKSAFTALDDVGKAVASLARLPPSEIPDNVRLVGSNISFKEVAEIMSSISGKPIETKEVELGPFKEKTTQKTEGDPASFIRFVMGEGNMDFSKNENEIVNPGQKLWKWKTVQEYAKEVGGLPWIEYGD